MSYEDALIHPFKPSAKGARCPDEHSFPTATYSITGSFTVSANSPQGDIDFMVTPCPFNCITSSAQFAGSITGPITGKFGQSQPFAAIPFRSAVATPATGPMPVIAPESFGYWGGVCSSDAVSNVLKDYRVVGYGARIRSLLPPNNQSGQVFLGSMPSPAIQPPAADSTYPDWMNFCQYPGLQDTEESITFPQQKWISTSILNLPASDQNMYSELTAERGMEWVGRYTGPDSRKFRDPDFKDILVDDLITDQVTNPARFASGAYVTNPVQTVVCDMASTNVLAELFTASPPDPVPVVQTENSNACLLDCFATGGWSSLALRATGINLSSATGSSESIAGKLVPVFAVEVIYHLEGTPVSGDKAALVGGSAIGFYEPTYFNNCVAKASKELFFRRVIEYDKGITSMFSGSKPRARKLGKRPKKRTGKSLMKAKRKTTMSRKMLLAQYPTKTKRVHLSSRGKGVWT
jgi:hypothetical protein